MLIIAKCGEAPRWIVNSFMAWIGVEGLLSSAVFTSRPSLSYIWTLSLFLNKTLELLLMPRALPLGGLQHEAG